MMKPAIALAWITLSTAGTASAATITVEPGDTLSGIAQRMLGDGGRWREICQQNRSLLRNCNLVPAGAVLEIPSSPQQPTADTRQPASEVQASGPNLIDESAAFSEGYWGGYWVKPQTSAGVTDPDGGQGATRMESADKPDDPGKNYSGLRRQQPVDPGVYDVEVWLRSTDGPMEFLVGMSDKAMNPAPVTVGEEWQKVSVSITAEQPLDRLFQVYERGESNPAWEIYGVKVAKRG